MKTDPLENYIRSHREAFDELEPDPRLWESISQSLDEPVKRKRFLPLLIKVSSIAAIFIAGYLFHVMLNGDKQAPAYTTETPSESIRMLGEARAYYTSQIEEYSEKVFSLAADQPDLRKDLQNEFKELDAMYASLENDLSDEVATEAVVEAMIQHYRVKLQLLEDMLQQLQQNNAAGREEVQHVY